MILLAIILPIVIYFFLVKYLFNKFYKGTNQKLRRVIFIGLITLPFWDHIVGYSIYKTLCLTNGGITIYKTVTDEQEQRDYWFYDGLNIFNNSYKGKEFDFFAKNKLVKRGICTDLQKDGVIGARVCKKGKFKEVYLNYCNPKYNNLPKTDKNYQSSCTNTDAIIKQYDLKNVIKVPKSPYESDHSGYKYTNFIWFVIGKGKGLMKNINTGEILYKSVNYKYRAGKYRGGWYLRYYTKPYLGIGGSESSCNNNLNIEDIIPNPYKNNN
jgi:hypothetical protein